MRPVTQTIYNIPSERVIGNNGLRYASTSTAARSCTWPSRTISTTAR